MPRSREQNDTLRSASRQKILDAALRLFARKGYADSSVKEVAAQAGVAVGLVYAHFEGKESLLRALFEQSMDDVRRSFALADQAEPESRLRALVFGAVAIVRANLDFWRLGYAARTQPAVLAALGPSLGEWTATIAATLRTYLAESGAPDPDIDALALFAQIDGLCQHLALDPERFPAERVAERVVERWSLSRTPPTQP